MDVVAEWMAEALLDAVRARPLPDAIEQMFLTDPLPELGTVAGVMFSGGVGEYVYARETRDFGDMGRRLGAAVRRRIDAGALPWPLLPAGECIRATALGASEYNVQLSGNTVYISDPAALLPRKNLQVLQPNTHCEEVIIGRLLVDHERLTALAAPRLAAGNERGALTNRHCPGKSARAACYE